MSVSPSAAPRDALRRLRDEFQALVPRFPEVYGTLVEAIPVRLPQFGGRRPRSTILEMRRAVSRVYDSGPPERSFYYYDNLGDEEGPEEYRRLARAAACCLANWPEAVRLLGLNAERMSRGHEPELWTLALHRAGWTQSAETAIFANRSTPDIDRRSNAMVTAEPSSPLLEESRRSWIEMGIEADCFISHLSNDSLFTNSVRLLDHVLDHAAAVLSETPPYNPPFTPDPNDLKGAEEVFPIILGGPEDEPIVRGHRKGRLTPGQYELVKALTDAHPNRLSKDQLVNRSGVEDPVGMIDRLRRKDKDWGAVLDKPGQPHGGYGIRSSPRAKT